MKTEPLGLFVERGGGGPAALTLSRDLGSGGRNGVEGLLVELPRESDGRSREIGVEGGFGAEGEDEGELDE